MRSVSVVSILVVVAMASAGPSGDKPYYKESDAPTLFENFIEKYNRNYKDDADREAHYRAFVASLLKINKLNEQSPSATYDINKFADYTPEETKTMFGLRRPDKEN